MSYWGRDNYEGLACIAAVAERISGLTDFAAYCRIRERRLRQETFAHLELFVTDARRWPFEERARFADWVMETQYKEPKVKDLIPHPLWHKLLVPTLDEWCVTEPENPVPFRWRGT